MRRVLAAITVEYVLRTLSETKSFHENIFQLRAPGFTCRESVGECDVPEECTGDNGQCPPDVYKKNGSPCAFGASGMEKASGNFLTSALELFD